MAPDEKITDLHDLIVLIKFSINNHANCTDDSVNVTLSEDEYEYLLDEINKAIENTPEEDDVEVLLKEVRAQGKVFIKGVEVRYKEKRKKKRIGIGVLT